MEKFIVTPKEDKSVTMTIRIDRALQEEYNDLDVYKRQVYGSLFLLREEEGELK